MKPTIIMFIAAVLLTAPVSAYYSDTIIPPESGFLPPFNATFPGERNAGQWFEFSMTNVSGYADVKYHYTVYDAQIKDFYEFRSDAWGQWWTQAPDRGKKFLFVWICGYSEGTTWWGWDAERFYLWDNGLQINQETVKFSDIGKWTVRPLPRTIRFMENRTSYRDFPYSQDPYGYKDGHVLSRMEPGKSNAMNGYIIYQVPATSTLKDMQILGWFGNSGSAWWNLEPTGYVQNSPEYAAITERERTTKEIRTGIRQRGNETVRMKG